MTDDELKSELEDAPENTLIVWATLYEDVYETVFGDGYFAYFADAFFSREEAERFASTPSAYRFHCRQVRLYLLNESIHAGLPELRPFESLDLDSLIAALSHDPTPRLPKPQY